MKLSCSIRTLCDPMDCSLPGSSAHGILQVLECVAWPSPGDLPNPGIEPWSPTLQADSLPSEPPGKSPKDNDNIWKKKNTAQLRTKCLFHQDTLVPNEGPLWARIITVKNKLRLDAENSPGIWAIMVHLGTGPLSEVLCNRTVAAFHFLYS